MQLDEVKMIWLEIYIHIGPSIISYIMKFDSDIHIYLNSIFIYTHTKISLPLFPIGPSKFAILFTRARIQIMMTMTILSTRPFGLIISLLYLIQAGVFLQIGIYEQFLNVRLSFVELLIIWFRFTSLKRFLKIIRI